MAINTRDFGKYYLADLVSSGVGEQIDRDRIERRVKRKWWNKIIPEIDEGQIIPNGISYKHWRNNFQLILRINNLIMRLKTGYHNTHRNHLSHMDSHFYYNDNKTGFGVTFDFKYN